MRIAIEARGASLVLLPPYSPDFNPIENAYAKFKSLLRQAAARTVDALQIAIADAFHAFTPQNTPTTSPKPDMVRLDRNLLYPGSFDADLEMFRERRCVTVARAVVCACDGKAVTHMLLWGDKIGMRAWLRMACA